MITFHDICHLYLISDIIILLYNIFICCHAQHKHNTYRFVGDLYNLSQFVMSLKLMTLRYFLIFIGMFIILIFLSMNFTFYNSEPFLQSTLNPAIFIHDY